MPRPYGRPISSAGAGRKVFGGASILGVDELEAKLRALVEKDARRVSRAAISAGLTVVARGIRSECPVGETKGLRKSIGRRIERQKRNQKGIVNGKVGVNVGRRRAGLAPHAHLAALGTVERETKAGANRGIMPMNSFVERGFDKSSAAAKARVLQKMAEGINKAAAKK